MTSTLYRGGFVHSPVDPFAEALLVEDGVVAWVGPDDSAAGFAGRADEVVDLDGRLLTAGFVDSHVHLLETAQVAAGVDLSAGAGVSSLADALARLHDAARRAPDGAVLTAFGWDESTWPEGRAPELGEVDAATGGRPVHAERVDAHSAVVSSSFAREAGLTTLDGWTDAGTVTRAAHDRAREVVRAVDPARREALYRAALADVASRGVVAVHEMSMPGLDTREGLRSLLELTADPASGLPLVVGYRGELCRTTDDARELLAAVPGLTGIGGDLDVDGSFGSRTAAVRRPYRDDPEAGTGALYLRAEQISAHLGAVTGAGTTAGFHVIGDRAMDELLLGLRVAGDVHGAGTVAKARLRVEHAMLVDAQALATLLVLGVGLSVQPAFLTAWGGPDGMYADRLGPARSADLLPLADLAQAGIPLALGSDSPVTGVSPWEGVRGAVEHPVVEQRISARAAFAAHTRGAWRLAGLEDGRGVGQLRVGAPAHLAVWDVEHLTVQPAPGSLSSWSAEARAGTPLLPDLADGAPAPTCVRTVRDGRVIFDTLG